MPRVSDINRRPKFTPYRRPNLHPETNTKLTKRTGWCAKGQRYRAYAPFGKWRTQTLLAGPRCHGLTAQFIVDAPTNRLIFEAWIETQLAPTLSKGDVVVLDNVGSQERARRPTDQATRRMVTVPASLLPVFEPYRDGILQAQDLTAKTCRTKLRCNHKSIGRDCRSFLH